VERKTKKPHGKLETPAPSGKADRLSAQLEALQAELPPAVLRVAHYLSRNRVAVLANSAAELAAMIGTSDATVVRTVQALGFQGLGELRLSIAASIGGNSAPLHHMHQTLEELTGKAGEAATAAANLVIDTHAESLLRLQQADARAQIHGAITKLHSVERLVIYAAGPSRPLAEYLSVLLSRHGQAAKVIGQGGLGLADDLLDLSERDGLLILSYGKPYREVLLTADEARKIGIPIVLVTDAPSTKLARTASAVIAARRGRAERVALHGTTLIALEALVMGLATANRSQTMRTLARLGTLRTALNKD
jgi:DNA-binding MurR/RpiR family transcriptional regulator